VKNRVSFKEYNIDTKETLPRNNSPYIITCLFRISPFSIIISPDYLVNSKPIIIIKNIQVNNNPTKNSIKALKKITEIINPTIIKTIPIIPIVDAIKNLFFILFTLQEQCFIINIFGRLSVIEK
jgi:hypothetical protein